MNSLFRLERARLLMPICAAAALCVTGCSNQTELLMPEGAFTPENTSHIPASNASPAPGIGIQGPAGSASVGGTMSVDDVLDIAPVTTPVVKPAPVSPVASVRRPPAVKAVAGDSVYKVRKGDTLGAIAKRYNIHWRAIADYNGIDNRGRIYVGQSLRIPASAGKKAVPAKKAAVKNVKSATAGSGKIHIVKKGEFPGKIAAQYKVRVADLLALNNITGKKTIYPGQKLRIPDAAAARTGKNAAAPKKKAVKKSAAQKTKPKAKAAPAKKAADSIPVVAPAEKKNSGDEVLSDLGQNDTKTSAAPAASSNVAVTPAKEKETSLDAHTPTLEMKLDRDMTLEQVAQAFDRSVDVLKKYNPNLKSGEVLKADTMIIVPIF